MGRIVARRSSDTAARMRARTAQIKAGERHPVISGANHRPRAEQLIQSHLAVENVAADQTETALQVERRMDLPGNDRFGEAWSMSINGCDNRVRRLFALVVPRPAIRQLVAEMLAE